MREDDNAARYQQAVALLPMRWQRRAQQLSESERAEAEELRLRVGQAMTVLLPQGELALSQDRSETVTQNDLDQLCDTITGYSRYAAVETLRQGYLTTAGGFRVGICGTMVMESGNAAMLRDFSSAVIRISRQHRGIAAEVLTQLLEDGEFHSTLILSPPGMGKTTLLRDLIRLLSDGTPTSRPYRVALSDERGEVAVMHRGQPTMDVGAHTDVLDGCPKAAAIPILLRAANPQIIAVDEITAEEDLRSISAAANCGVVLLATIHAGSVAELKNKPLFANLLNMNLFKNCVTIKRDADGRRYEVAAL